MFTENDLQDLLDYRTDTDVLSVYLNTEPTEGGVDAHKLRLRSMLKEVDLPEDVALVEEYIEREFGWSGRSIALFSCAGDDFFRAYPLAVPVRSRIRVDNRPQVKPFIFTWGNCMNSKKLKVRMYAAPSAVVAHRRLDGEGVCPTKPIISMR
jgi:hypothetical protein